MAPPKARRNTTIAAGICYLICVPFLILVAVGNTHNQAVIRDTYFFRLDVSQIIPISVDDSHLLNSVARSLGLHDFYQVGIFNFCEGYNDEGITYCPNPEQFYWFNPVEILVSELLAGAKIALPSQALTILKLLRIGSQVMYGFFIAANVVNLVLLCSTFLAVRSRWFSLPLSLLALVGVVVVAVAAIIGTVISLVFKYALTAQDQLNIRVDIGVRMFAFMWIAAGLMIVAFFLHAAMGCCCKPQRGQSNQSSPRASQDEKQSKMHLPKMMRRRKGASSAGSISPMTGGTPTTETTPSQH